MYDDIWFQENLISSLVHWCDLIKCESCIYACFLGAFVTRIISFTRTMDYQTVGFHKLPKPLSASRKWLLWLRTTWIPWPLIFDIFFTSTRCVFDCHISTPLVETQSLCSDNCLIQHNAFLRAFNYPHHQVCYHQNNWFIFGRNGPLLWHVKRYVCRSPNSFAYLLYVWNGVSSHSKIARYNFSGMPFLYHIQSLHLLRDCQMFVFLLRFWSIIRWRSAIGSHR